MRKLFENKLFEIISAIYPPVDSPFRDEHEIRTLARGMTKVLEPLATHMKNCFDLGMWHESAFADQEGSAKEIVDKMRNDPTFQLGCYLIEMAPDEVEFWLNSLQLKIG